MNLKDDPNETLFHKHMSACIKAEDAIATKMDDAACKRKMALLIDLRIQLTVILSAEEHMALLIAYIKKQLANHPYYFAEQIIDITDLAKLLRTAVSTYDLITMLYTISEAIRLSTKPSEYASQFHEKIDQINRLATEYAERNEDCAGNCKLGSMFMSIGAVLLAASAITTGVLMLCSMPLLLPVLAVGIVGIFAIAAGAMTYRFEKNAENNSHTMAGKLQNVHRFFVDHHVAERPPVNDENIAEAPVNRIELI